MQSSSDLYLDQQPEKSDPMMEQVLLDEISLKDKIYRTKLRQLKAYITHAYLKQDNAEILKEALDLIEEELLNA